MIRARWSLLAALCLPVGAARAEDEAPPPVPGSARLDISAYRDLPVVDGPVLVAGSDTIDPEGRPTSWSLSDWSERGGRRTPWIEFEEGAGPEALAPEQVIEVLQALLGPAADGLTISHEAGQLRLSGPAAEVERARALLPWILDLEAPSAEISAALLGGGEGGLVAAGRARLFAGRWTRLWLQEQRPVYPVEWDIEIAQEAVAMNPVLTALSEGQELYLRWLPGESVSLVELWSGDLEHLDEVVIDLTGVRNVPESSGMAAARIPRTAIRRAYTAVLLQPGAGAFVAWRGPDGERRLRLDLRSLTPVPEPRASGELVLGQLRTGAVAAGLLFGSRVGQGDWLESQLYGIAGDELSLGSMSYAARSLLGVRVRPAAFEPLRAGVRRLEEELASATLRVRTLTVPEESLRAALAQGELAVGAALGAAALEALKRAGAVEGTGVDLPLVSGVKAGFRVGASVPGLVRLDVEVAQQSAGLDPLTGARFAGLAGEAGLRRGSRGLELRLDATLSWADPKGGSVEVVFRPPVGMAFSKDAPRAELEGFRRVTLPALAGGSAEVFADLSYERGDGAERLVGVSVRGGEAVLVLAALEAP